MVRGAPRSSRYFDCLAKLDAPDSESLDLADVVQTIEAEFGLGLTVPLGYVAKCYLGAPYQVHILDLAGGIVEHFYIHQPLPGPFERARHLAQHAAYSAIEVYPDRLVCLRSDGATVEVNQ